MKETAAIGDPSIYVIRSENHTYDGSVETSNPSAEMKVPRNMKSIKSGV